MIMGKESEKALKEDIEGGMAKELGREEEKRLEQEMSQDMAKELGREEEKRLEQEIGRASCRERVCTETKAGSKHWNGETCAREQEEKASDRFYDSQGIRLFPAGSRKLCDSRLPVGMHPGCQ